MDVDALVVLPTVNERPNVERLVPAVFAALPGTGVLVVDDASEDGTPAAAEAAAAGVGPLHVLRRHGRQGLGRAYLDGFRWALAHTPARHVFEMDADGSHDPAYLHPLRAAASGGVDAADVAVGSRYLPGGGIVDWEWRRRWLSRFGAAYARRLTGLPLTDPTSGFKCFRRRVLETLDLGAIRSNGYAFQIEASVLAWRAGFRVCELPIVFRDRRHGVSKLTGRVGLEAAWRCLALAGGGPRHPVAPPTISDQVRRPRR